MGPRVLAGVCLLLLAMAWVPGLEGSPVKEEQMQGDDWSVSGILRSVLVQPLQKFAGDVTSAITSTESWKKLKTPGHGFITPAVGLVKELYDEYLAWVWPRLATAAATKSVPLAPGSGHRLEGHSVAASPARMDLKVVAVSFLLLVLCSEAAGYQLLTWEQANTAVKGLLDKVHSTGVEKLRDIYDKSVDAVGTYTSILTDQLYHWWSGEQ
ncbi:uncharacterized protein LOC112548659 [Alligator sinensis]|uniref:Apolipoprotein C-II n=1 Tax=Alligator sinensis TaxID=38654 RepID=A0A3Q0FUA8_ALLSI|nr:uncharacterized protein LOC112548659 [Alligator sinensis]